jgi:hypothetical protein
VGDLHPAVLLLTRRRWLVASFAIALSSCGAGAERGEASFWKGWVYPDGFNLTVSREIGRFDSFEDCQAAALGVIALLDQSMSPAYECGRNCRFDEDLGLSVCSETRD